MRLFLIFLLFLTITFSAIQANEKTKKSSTNIAKYKEIIKVTKKEFDKKTDEEKERIEKTKEELASKYKKTEELQASKKQILIKSSKIGAPQSK